MPDYRVNFYRTLLSSQGHNFKCLQREIDVRSDSPSGALKLAQSQIGSSLAPDCIEIVHTHRSPDFYERLDESELSLARTEITDCIFPE